MDMQKKAERLLDQISQVSDLFLEQTLDTDTEEKYVCLGRKKVVSSKRRENRSQAWRYLRNMAVAAVAVICIFAMGGKGGSCGVTETYFDHIYRIQGIDYSLKEKSFLWLIQWNELWKEVNGEEVLCHRFPVWSHPVWSEEREAFVYRKGRSFYQWDLETNRETRIYRMPKRSLWTMVMDFFLDRSPSLWGVMQDHLLLKDSDGVPVLVDLTAGSEIRLEVLEKSYSCVTMDDYILFERNDGNTRLIREEYTLILLELSSGTVIDEIPLGNSRINWWTAEGNQVFFSVRDAQAGDQLYRYDADLQKMYPIKIRHPEKTAEEYEGHRDIFPYGMIFKGILWCIQSWDKDVQVVYQLNLEGTLIAHHELPAGQQFETRAFGDGYIIIVTKSELDPPHEKDCLLHYYIFMENGEGKEVFTWQVLDALTLHQCVVICDGDLVVSGCQLEEERIQFSVGDTNEIKVEEIYGR